MSTKRTRDTSPGSTGTTHETNKSRKEIWTGDEDHQNAKLSPDAGPKSSPTGFLDLPREIRDMIYEYVVGKHRDRGPVCYAGEWYYWKQYDRAKNEGTINQPSYPIVDLPFTFASVLSVNKQVHEETSTILYEQNTFFAINPLIGSAIPPGWDLARIQHLCIGISIFDHEGQKYHECSFTMQHPVRSRYEDLRSQQLTSLRTVRLFVAVTTYDGPVSYPYYGNVRFSPPPAPDPDHVLSEQLYRYFLHLPFSRLCMMFGLDDQNAQVWVIDGSCYAIQHSGYRLDFLPGADIQQKYDEFKSPGPGSLMVGSRWGITYPAEDTEDTADGNGDE
jgi:hypothetical protein